MYRRRRRATAAFNGVIFRLRSGSQWTKLPKRFGDGSTVHHGFQRWCRTGVFRKVWIVLVAECDDLGAVDWE